MTQTTSDGGSTVRFHRAGPSGPGSAELPVHVARDVWVDLAASPMPVPSEAASLVVPGSVVSLHSVLGDRGVVPRPSRVVTAVAFIPGAEDGSILREAGSFGEYVFRAMPSELVEAGAPEDRLDTAPAWSGPYAHARATAEKALCDWLWVSSVQEGPYRWEPPLDCDLDDVDMERLDRLAEAMGIVPVLEDWLGRVAVLQSDEEHGEQFGSRFGP